jgi:hypothetical protein
MKARATAPKKQPGTEPDRATGEDKHGWHGDEVEERDGPARHLSETPEAAASRAEGNAPVDASAEARRSESPDTVAPSRPSRPPHDVADERDQELIDELKRQAAAEEHAAARAGRVVRGPI